MSDEKICQINCDYLDALIEIKKEHRKLKAENEKLKQALKMTQEAYDLLKYPEL